MNIAIFNWRDLGHPKAGGAEVVTHALASGLTQRGHQVTWYTSRHPRAPRREVRNGYTVMRCGSELTCRLHAFWWLRKRCNDFDIVIDEVNTLPFLSRFATRRPVLLWLQQLAREVWIAEAPPVIGHIGYLLEPVLLAIYRGAPVVTISRSSAHSFAALGIGRDVRIVGVPLAPPDMTPAQPIVGRIGYVGRIAPSKRIDHVIRALAVVRASVPDAELVAIGNGPVRERRRLELLAQRLGVAHAVTFTGWTSRAERDALMRTFDVLALASMREGWGLVVSEAARYRVPSVVYPVAGLVDSVRNGVTGIVVAAHSPAALAAGLTNVIGDRLLRDRLGESASAFIRKFTERRFVDAFEASLAREAMRSYRPAEVSGPDVS
ncbi:MAG: glycosyltransferase family 4 protein [Candidatus Tyrphobacter sp.]